MIFFYKKNISSATIGLDAEDLLIIEKLSSKTSRSYWLSAESWNYKVLNNFKPSLQMGHL